jgi:hypothetical protein
MRFCRWREREREWGLWCSWGRGAVGELLFCVRLGRRAMGTKAGGSFAVCSRLCFDIHYASSTVYFTLCINSMVPFSIFLPGISSPTSIRFLSLHYVPAAPIIISYACLPSGPLTPFSWLSIVGPNPPARF